MVKVEIDTIKQGYNAVSDSYRAVANITIEGNTRDIIMFEDFLSRTIKAVCKVNDKESDKKC